MVSTRMIDRGWRRAMAAARAMNGRSVAVGIRAGKQNDEGVDLIEIAAWNEFGTKNEDGTTHIPSRPFLRETADEVQAGPLHNYARRIIGRILAGQSSPDDILDMLGMWMVQRIRSKMRKSKSWAVPNADSTVKAKGSSVPLIEHGLLARSVDYEKR